ncbi:MAG: GNAT family protein [Balneolaceae bacterium]|nr:GNAT family protein [Balneolaceae bacterium]
MVTLKPFDLQNVAIHHKWNNDEELNYYDSEYPHQEESFESFLKRIKSVLDRENKTANLFEIHLQKDDKLIGIVDIHAIDTYNRRCFINCTIGDREYNRKEHSADALNQTLSYCFEKLEMHKVGTTAFDFNHAWIDTVQAIGFKKEGELREHVLKRGEFRNKLIYSILDQEYQEQSGNPISDLSFAQ